MTDKVARNYLHAYLDRHPVRSYKKGEIIIFQGEEPKQALVVKSGIVKSYNLSVDGDEKPISFYQEDTVFPYSWVYSKTSSSVYFYEAFSESVEVYLVDRTEYVNFIKQRPELLYQEFERLLSDQLAGAIRLNALQHSKASDKLIYTLHYLARSYGKPIGKQKIEISLDLKHQDFANLTGITRETAATELSKLKRSGVISYSKTSPYVLDLARLTKSLNDEYIADLDAMK